MKEPIPNIVLMKIYAIYYFEFLFYFIVILVLDCWIIAVFKNMLLKKWLFMTLRVKKN